MCIYIYEKQVKHVVCQKAFCSNAFKESIQESTLALAHLHVRQYVQ